MSLEKSQEGSLSHHVEEPFDDTISHGKVDEAMQSDPRDDPQWITTEKRLVRKLDMTLLPMVWLLYMFNYLDRNNIA